MLGQKLAKLRKHFGLLGGEVLGFGEVVGEGDGDRDTDAEPDVVKETDGEGERLGDMLCVPDVENVGEIVLVRDCVADAE